jgi:hypothetical protein
MQDNVKADQVARSVRRVLQPSARLERFHGVHKAEHVGTLGRGQPDLRQVVTLLNAIRSMCDRHL